MAPVKTHAYQADSKLKAVGHIAEHGNRAAAKEFNTNELMEQKKQEDGLCQVKNTRQSFRGKLI